MATHLGTTLLLMACLALTTWAACPASLTTCTLSSCPAAVNQYFAFDGQDLCSILDPAVGSFRNTFSSSTYGDDCGDAAAYFYCGALDGFHDQYKSSGCTNSHFALCTSSCQLMFDACFPSYSNIGSSICTQLPYQADNCVGGALPRSREVSPFNVAYSLALVKNYRGWKLDVDGTAVVENGVATVSYALNITYSGSANADAIREWAISVVAQVRADISGQYHVEFGDVSVRVSGNVIQVIQNGQVVTGASLLGDVELLDGSSAEVEFANAKMSQSNCDSCSGNNNCYRNGECVQTTDSDDCVSDVSEDSEWCGANPLDEYANPSNDNPSGNSPSAHATLQFGAALFALVNVMITIV